MRERISKMMSNPLLVFICLCFLLSTPPAQAGGTSTTQKQDSLRAERLAKVAAFRQAYPGVELHTNPVTGIPEDLYGDLSKGQTKSDPVEAAYEFLQQNKDLYGITNPGEELKIVNVSKDKYGATVFLSQTYKGVPVAVPGVRAHFTAVGKLKGISGGFAPGIDISTTPAIDSNAAIQIAKRDLNYTNEDEKTALRAFESLGLKEKRPITVSLIVATYEGQYHLTWLVSLYRYKSAETWEYGIDSHSGTILWKRETGIKDGVRSEGNVSPIPRPVPKDSASTPIPKSAPKGEVPEFPAQPIGPGKNMSDSKESLPMLKPRMNVSDSFPFEKTRGGVKDSSGLFYFGPKEVRLNQPIDSIIKNLKQQEEEKQKKETRSDSGRSDLSTTGAVFANIMTENFEGIFPRFRSNWYAFDNDSTIHGEYFWGQDDFLPHLGGWSAWCARGGANGLDPQFNNYQNYMQSWMAYGPFSLTDATDAELDFYFWLKSEFVPSPLKYDALWWGISTDGQSFYFPEGAAGNFNGWVSKRLPLDSIDLGGGFYQNLIGLSGLWIAFLFESDATVTDKGAFLDDIVLKKDAPSGTPDLACAQPPPPGWAGPIVVSNVSNTNTQSQPFVNRTTYIDWAYKNIGTRATSTLIWSNLYIDGTLRGSWYTEPPFNTSDPPLGVQDFPWTFTTPGIHRIELKHDYYITEMEIDEFNNSCFYDVNVAFCPSSDQVGTGTSVLGNPQGHIDTWCSGSNYQLIDLTREANNNPHGHNGRMRDFTGIITFLDTNLNVFTDLDTIWDAQIQASGVDAQVYAGLTYDYLANPFYLNRNGFDDSGKTMRSYTDDPFTTDPKVGAGYDPNIQIVRYTPQNSLHLSFAGAIDQVGHEWGHGVTDFASKLGSSKEPGALNESFSDMLGVTIGFATGRDPDWQTGEHVVIGEPAISDLSEPNNTYKPNTFKGQYWQTISGCTTPDTTNDYCGVHYNSGVPNKMFYLFAAPGQHIHNKDTVNGIGIDNAMKVMLRANRVYWDSLTNFLQARIRSIQAAKDLNPVDTLPLRKAWDAVRVCPKGDVNQDGVLTATDVVLLMNLAYLGIFQGVNYCASDLDCDGIYISADVVRELNWVFLGILNPCIP